MKVTIRLFLASLALAFIAPAALTAADHEHDQGKRAAGPNGGRLITSVEPHAEFFVTADRKVQITFVDDAGKVVAPTTQVVTVTTGDRAAPTRMKFARSGDLLVSEAALPAGDSLPAVVQIQASPNATAVVERFNLNLSTCPGCNYAEYACICEGH